jgi:hypothetical protein
MNTQQTFNFGGITLKLAAIEMVGPVEESNDGLSYGFLVRTSGGHEVEFCDKTMKEADKRRAQFIDLWIFNLTTHE